MKKFLAVILCILMVVSVAMFASCGNNTTDAPKEEKPVDEVVVDEVVEDEVVVDEVVEDEVVVDEVVEDEVVEDEVVADAGDIETVKSKLAARKVNNKFAAALTESVKLDAEVEAVVEEAATMEATSANPLLGAWRYSAVDVMELLDVEGAMEAEGLYIDFSPFEVAVLLSVTEDEMVIATDLETLEKDAYEFCDELIDGIGENIIIMMEEEGLTLADFEEEFGMTFDEFMDYIEEESVAPLTESIAQMVEQATYVQTLPYELDGNTINYEDGTSESFEVNGDTLTLYSGDMALEFARV